MTSEISLGEGNYQDLEKNSSEIIHKYNTWLPINIVHEELCYQSRVFYVHLGLYWSRTPLKLSLNLAQVENSEFFKKIPVRIILDVLFHAFRFSKVFFHTLTSIHNILKLCRHLGTETNGRLPWQFCNFTCEITN